MRQARRDAQTRHPSHGMVMLVNFEVRVETVYGDTVVVVGSTPQLGSWNPERGVRMYTDELSYPVWRANQWLECEGNTPLEYKCVIMRASGSVEWEVFTGNRRLFFAGDEVCTCTRSLSCSHGCANLTYYKELCSSLSVLRAHSSDPGASTCNVERPHRRSIVQRPAVAVTCTGVQ